MSKLFSSYEHKNINIKNRLVMPPMATSKCLDGKVNTDLINHYLEKSHGGYIGLIIIEHSYISLDGKASNGQLSISDDSDIEGLKVLVENIQKNGSKVYAQINHAGMQARHEIIGQKAIAPSAVLNPRYPDYPIPKEMNINQINKIKKYFVDGALRAKKAGFDGVEIHSAHGYLLNQFYSPLTNQRTDNYGGSLKNRLRIHNEIIVSIREVVGKDYPIALRLGACDYMDGGSTIDDAVEAAKILESSGIDLLDISGGFIGYIIPGVNKQGYFSDVSNAIKKEINIPVLLTGGITDPEFANKLLIDNKADFIGVGRAILKDSFWPKKAYETLQNKI
ncbi:MAG: NADH:flavin oxidoreductase [Erysipelotrichaceae bacterium]|nr:NADH:flavin oxidoreductase [Erysipelotrichaceae bacterium]